MGDARISTTGVSMQDEIQAAVKWWGEHLIDTPDNALPFVFDSKGVSDRKPEFEELLHDRLESMLLSKTWNPRMPIYGTLTRTFGTRDGCAEHVVEQVLTEMGVRLEDTDLPTNIVMHINPGSVYIRRGYGQPELVARMRQGD